MKSCREPLLQSVVHPDKFELHEYDRVFQEFLLFKEKGYLSNALNKYNLKNKDLLNDETVNEGFAPFKNEIKLLFEEFVLYGGYPKVVLAKSRHEKLDELNELLDAYELKDINVLFNIANIHAFRNLFKIMAGSIGNLLNVNELSGTIGIGRDTAIRYLSILENTFIIHQLPPFHRNIRKELTKMPKLYFMDTGLRNFALRNFSELKFRPDRGPLFENSIFCELYKNLDVMDQLFFWRTIAKNEVDFILTGERNFAFEVKYGVGTLLKHPTGLKAFEKIYKDFKQFVITFDIYADKGKIILLPFWML